MKRASAHVNQADFSNAADLEPWSSLDRAVINAFRRIGVVLRYHLILPHRATLEQIRRILRSVHSVSRRGKFVCKCVRLILLCGSTKLLELLVRELSNRRLN